MNFAIYFTIIIILIRITGTKSDDNFKIESLPAGLYHSDIGTAHLSKGVYEFVHFYNISDILTEKELLIQLKASIKAHLPSNKCTNGYNALLNIDDDIEKTLDAIEFITELCLNSEASFDRVKRGLLGKVLTFFFGVNDEAYDALNELQLQNKDLLNYTNNINFIVQEKLKETQTVIQAKITQMTNKMNNQTMDFYEKVLELHIFDSIRNIEKKIDKIMSTINAKGDWHEHFSYKNMKQIISKANVVLKNEVREYSK